VVLFYILTTTLIISLLSLLGILAVSYKEEVLNKILILLVSLSAGTMLGGAFLHLLPEGIENSEPGEFLLLTLLSFILFFVIEKVFHWHHCHDKDCSDHSLGFINLLGDTVHNFIDGIIIAVAFSQSITLGITASIAIALHEIPQEIGDFGILLYAGISKRRAIFLNFLVALTVVLGGLVGFTLLNYTETIIQYLLPLAAGSFIYIATSDLIPEIKKEEDLAGNIKLFFFFMLGVLLMYLLRFFE